MTNAIKFTRKGIITVSACLKSTQNIDRSLMLEVTVADEGIGIPANEVSTIFDGFRET